LPNDIEIVDYKIKNTGISPVQARQTYEHYWRADEFKWNGTHYNVASYGSHGQNDVNLNALKISKNELNKVNEIIEKINSAKEISNLPQPINNYDQDKVPKGKNYSSVETLYNNKRDQIKTAQTRKVQPDINEIENELNKKLESIRAIITNAQNILNKNDATKEELETAINDLKIMANANTDSPEKIV